jgi:hypothetical protein
MWPWSAPGLIVSGRCHLLHWRDSICGRAETAHGEAGWIAESAYAKSIGLQMQKLFLVFPQLISVESGRHLSCSRWTNLFKNAEMTEQFRKAQTSASTINKYEIGSKS